MTRRSHQAKGEARGFERSRRRQYANEDNRQTIRLATEESANLTTRLPHVDNHNYWLPQEY
ncbi:hypothetical protein SEPCBS119000_002278 [Sporothrix epigloea]|uniref:Uncharacterized protein n=1 Tax=Sporothrix epigloea TaxID=1892477 RepID=A0ABP0DFA0_9PEZI